jgi:hypothetical protein
MIFFIACLIYLICGIVFVKIYTLFDKGVRSDNETLGWLTLLWPIFLCISIIFGGFKLIFWIYDKIL